MTNMTHGMLDMMINNREIKSIMSKPLPAGASIQMAKLIRKCNEELKEYSEKKQEIVQEFSKKDTDGKPIMQPGGMVVVDPIHTNEAQKAIDEISKIPVGKDFKIPTIKFNPDSLPDMTPNEAMAILPFMEE